jgi:hydroxyacylglutathione hydrolase
MRQPQSKHAAAAIMERQPLEPGSMNRNAIVACPRSPAEADLPVFGGRDAPPAQSLALIPALQDNYIAVLHDARQAVVVDPAEAEPVAAWLAARGLELVAVLQTHHHHDHIGGTPGLLQRWPAAAVVAAAADQPRIPFLTHGVGDGDRLCLLGRAATVLAVPGHTRAHLAYHLPALAPGAGALAPPRWDGRAFRLPAAPGWGELFCGDTLFLAGCGRLFEGTPAQMHASLQRLAALPARTRVWCAHEYTLTNLRWALQQRPDQARLRQRLEAVEQRRQVGLPSVPGTLAEERDTNLFLRAGSAAELAELRASRNAWAG